MKRIVFGMMLSLIGLVYSSICFAWAIENPWRYHGIDGLLGSFLGTETLVPFILSTLLLMIGVAICCCEAFRKR